MSDTPQPPEPTPSTPPAPEPKKKPSRLKRWLLIVGGVVVVLIVIGIVSAPAIVRAVIRHEVNVQVADNLNATLEIDDLAWHPLLGVEIKHARLVTPGPNGSEVPVAELSGMTASLAKIPLGGPIVVDNFTLVDPTIDLVRLPDGELQIQGGFLKPQPPQPATPWKNPSELIQIQHFALQNMTVRYSDFQSPAPAVVAKVDVSSDLTSGPGTYSLHVKFTQDPMSQLTMDGTANIDGATLTFDHFAFTGQIPGGQTLTNFPPEIQDAIHHYGLDGAGVVITVASGASATVDMAKSRWDLRGFKGDIKLTGPANAQVASGVIHFNITGGGPLPSAATPLNVNYLKSLDADTVVSVSADPNDKPEITGPMLPHPVTGIGGALEFSKGQFSLQGIQATYGSLPIEVQASATVSPEKIDVQGLHLSVDRDAVLDSAAEIEGDTLTLNKFSFTGQVPSGQTLATFPQGIQDAVHRYNLDGAGVVITLAKGAAATVDTGKNRWQLKGFNGDIKLTSSASVQVASGVIDFNATGGGPLPAAGTPLDLSYLKSLDADTLVSISADANNKPAITGPMLPHPVTDIAGMFQYTKGQFTAQGVGATYGPLPITLQASAAVGADKINLSGLRVTVANGAVLIDSADLSLKAPYECNANVAYTGIDIAELKKVLPVDDPDGRLSGKASGELVVSGPLMEAGVSPLQSLSGQGKTHIADADFWSVKFLDRTIGKVVPGIADAARIGDAGVVYSFKDGTLTLSKMAIGCPVVGVQGSGDIGMTGDNELNLTLLVAPLGDWKKQANQVGIPGLSQAFGVAQNAFNKVQSNMFSFKVTGPAADPQINATPLPNASGEAKDIFGKMANGVQGIGQKGSGLLDLIGGKNDQDNGGNGNNGGN